MEVNTNIYGNEDMWITVNPTNWGSNVSEEEKIKIANFTNLTPEELGNNPDPRKASALGCAAYKMSQDSSWTINGDDGAFNKSVSFVGMSGNKCPYTSIKYFSNINNDQYTSNYPITQLESDTYDIVNFAFHNIEIVLYNDYGNNKRFMDIYKSAQGGGGNGNAIKDWYVRWNPDPFLGNGPSSTYPNYLNSVVSDYASSIRNQDINFVTQMPCRRVVLVPFITCSDGNDSSVGTYDLDTYLTTYKTTKPRIISVSFATYIAYKDSDAPTSSNQRQLKYFAMSLLQSSNKFSNHYVSIKDSNTRNPAENLFYPYLLMSPYIPLGGALNNGHSNNNKPSGLSTQPWSSGAFDNSSWYSVMAVCDLGDMGWTNWSGNNTGETGRGEYLYCNADNLTADEIRESVRAGLACFGMFFTDSVADAQTKQLDEAGMFLGTLVNGIGYGDYTEGTANREQPQFNWKAMNESDYDPENPPEPDIPDDSTEDTKNKTVLPSRGMLMPFTGSYVFDYLPLTGVINACTHHYIDMQDAIEDWNLNKEEYEDSLDFESYLWRQWGRQANPVDCLQNITYYPFNIRPHMTGLTNTTVIQVGSFVHDYAGTGVVGSKVGATTTTGSIWCGNGENSGMKFPITDANDFRSYAPYVSATLYLPFCGSIELDPQVFVGHTIKVNYLVDWRTGVCLALVYRDNLVVEAVSGQMGNKVNIQMLDGTTWASQLANASVQESNAHFNRATNFFATVGGLVKIAAGAALIVGTDGIGTSVGGGLITSGVGNVANSFIKGNQIDVAENKAAYDIGTTPIPTRQISTASPAVNASNEMRVRLVVFKSEEEDKSNYAHTVGHACLKYGTLNNLKCTGYTVCQTIDTAGINATEAEKEKIRSLLMGGVYV